MMKRIAFGICLSFITTAALAKRKHAAHDHGVVKLSISVDGASLVATLESPGESIVGFEHEAKSADDKKKQEDALTKLKNDFGPIIGLRGDHGCRVMESEAKVNDGDQLHDKIHKSVHGKKSEHKHEDHGHKEAEAHSDVDAFIKVTCTKPLIGSDLTINFAPYFPKVKKVLLQLSGVKQEKPELNTFPAVIKLEKL